MFKKQFVNLLVAFLLGVLLTLLLVPNSDTGRYVPYGSRNYILDTKKGRAYAPGAKGVWILKTEKVGVTKRKY